MPEQQPGSYRGGEMMTMTCQCYWWRKPEYPEETTVAQAENSDEAKGLRIIFLFMSRHNTNWC